MSFSVFDEFKFAPLEITNYYHTFIIAAPLPGPPPALSLVIPDVPLPGPDLASEPAPLIKSEAMTSTSRQNHNNNVIAAEAAEEVDAHHIGNVQLFCQFDFHFVR